MKKTFNILAAALLVSACAFLEGCSAIRTTPQVVFDLGVPAPLRHNTGLPPMFVAEPSVAPWLDSFEIYYRLAYANDHQLRPYTNSRWSMPPLQLFEQRLKFRLAEAGGQVLSASENANNVPLVLHIDADDFTHVFDSPEHSSGQIAMRVSLFDHRNLAAQKTFSRQSAAPSNDAAGGARALSDACDALIADILQWLSELSLKK